MSFKTAKRLRAAGALVRFLSGALAFVGFLAGCAIGPSTPATTRQPPLPPGVETDRAMPSTPEQTSLEDTNPPAPVFTITLVWDYPDELRDVTTFVIHGSADVSAPEPWDALGDTTNLTAQVAMSAQQFFFYITASNFWTAKESIPSNVQGTPAPPRLVKTTIQ